MRENLASGSIPDTYWDKSGKGKDLAKQRRHDSAKDKMKRKGKKKDYRSLIDEAHSLQYPVEEDSFPEDFIDEAYFDWLDEAQKVYM